MGSYSPGEPASPDNEATRPLRAGTPARDGATRSPGNFFVRLRAAWKSMRNPEASPEELGTYPTCVRALSPSSWQPSASPASLLACPPT